MRGWDAGRYPESLEHVAMGTPSLRTGMHQLEVVFHVDWHLVGVVWGLV